ncbi:sulfatase [bacterium]|nr:sulfatase [bacterium]
MKPQPVSQPVRQNVVLVSIDTLRSDHLGAWGFPGGYSPTLDRLAFRGLIRETMFTVIPHTTPAHASLLTGLYPVNHGSRDNAFAIRNDVPTIAEIMKLAGYNTAGSVGHFLLSGKTSGFDRGFDAYWSPPEPDSQPHKKANGKTVFPLATNAFRPWKNVNSHASQWLKTVQEPYFLFLHYYECHGPYSPPVPWNKIEGLHLYDGEIAGINCAISNILHMLTDRGTLDTTEIIVTADHGESLGEHGYQGHGYHLYYPSMSIPWITWGGKGFNGIWMGISRIMDIMPTILAHREMPVPLKLDGKAESSDVKNIFGESPSLYAGEPQRRIRSIRNSRYLLINRKNTDNTELYHTRDDPAELNNMFKEIPLKTKLLMSQLTEWTDADTAKVLRPEEQLDPGVLDALKALGYLD